MAKGSTCPNCGKQTYQSKENDPVRRCSNCAAIGWLAVPAGPGGGKGSKCRLCGKSVVRELATIGGTTVRHCYNCRSTYLTS